MVLVNSSLRTGPLPPKGPEKEGTYNEGVSIKMLMLKIMGQDSGLDASVQWMGGLWWWWWWDSWYKGIRHDLLDLHYNSIEQNPLDKDWILNASSFKMSRVNTHGRHWWPAFTGTLFFQVPSRNQSLLSLEVHSTLAVLLYAPHHFLSILIMSNFSPSSDENFLRCDPCLIHPGVPAMAWNMPGI